MMRKKLNKLISFFMLFILIITSMPLEIAFARFQNPINDFKIIDYSPITSADYEFDISWDRPEASELIDYSALEPSSSDYERATGYDVFYRNSTKTPQFPADPQYNFKTNDEHITERIKNLPLDKGSIYSFKVVPYHYHQYKTVDATGKEIFVDRRAPYTIPIADMRQHLYLTDISVSASGAGTEMTVQWDNPTFDGKEIFSGYRIYYAQGGSNIPEIPRDGSGRRDVLMDDSKLKRLPNNRLEYTFTDQDLQIGSFYAVKVEPLIGSQAFRFTGKDTSLYINNINYRLSYVDYKREYRTNEAYVKPKLRVVQDGLDHIRLIWGSLANVAGDIVKVDILQSDTGDFTNSSKLIGTLYDPDTKNTNYWRLKAPEGKTYYMIKIYFKLKPGEVGESGYRIMESEVATYDPKYADFYPYSPTILPPITDNEKAPYSLNVWFKAFTRLPYNKDEIGDPKINGLYLDKDMEYTVWVSDDLRTLEDPAIVGFPIATLPATNLREELKTDEFGNEDYYYNSIFTQYIRRNPITGAIELVPLESNKVYYIKIIATRKPGEQQSRPAYGSHYIRPSEDVALIPQMIPVYIKKDENGVEVITDKSITIQWDLKYFEAYNGNNYSWYNKIGVKPDGTVVFGKDTETEGVKVIYLNDLKYLINMKDPEQAKQRIKSDLLAAGANPDEANKVAFRYMDLTNKQYEIHTVEYDYMTELGTYDDYVNKLLSADEDRTLWTKIQETGDPNHPEFEVTKVDAPTPGDIKPNTSYVIFFRPFIEKNGKKIAYYPSYVTATTLTERFPTDIDPTVPKLEPVSATDTTLEVRWESSKELLYELRYSELLTDYPNGGTVISKEDIVKNGRIVNEDGKQYTYYTITGLFPDTVYYLWIKAISVVDGKEKSSAWSNPIDMKTKDIMPPDPPKNLGLAGKTSVENYNKENKTEYVPLFKDYMIIEWMRDYLDLNNPEAGEAAPAPTPPPEGGEGDKKEPDAVWLQSPSLLSTYMVKFNNLTPNSPYYIRAKTILTVKRGENGGIVRSYSYTVQISPYEDFSDFVEITVPPLEAFTDGTKMKRKESDWSKAIVIKSGKSDGTYDGDVNDNLYPLPEQDFEISYDPYSQTLTYRFRSDKVGADGLKDNQVDQRLISRLVQNRTYTYGIDLSAYDNRYNVRNRVIEMPYSIFTAFEERKIDLKVRAGNVSITVPPGAVANAEVKSMSDFGKGSTVKMNVKTTVNTTPAISPAQSYASTPQELSVLVSSPSRTVNVKNFNKDILVEMNLDNRYSVLDKNIGAYTADSNSAGWQPVSNKYNNVAATMSFYTPKAGNYSAIAGDVPVSSVADVNRNEMYNVTTRITISDMASYDSNKVITANQFNNIIAAVANNKTAVEMNAHLSNGDFQELGKSKLLVSGTNVTNEAGVSSLVRLYEIKTQSKIKDYPDITQSSLYDISSADPQYQESLLKADYLGFFTSASANPKGGMTFGDFMYMLSIVLEDSAS